MLKCLSLIFALVISPAAAQVGPQPDKHSPNISSFETGVICAQPVVGSEPAPGTLAGVTNIIDEDPPFVSNARRVPAVIGVGFGLKAQSAAPDGISGVTMIVTHPPMGPTGTTHQMYMSSINGDKPAVRFYQFDFDYELVTGIWQLEAQKNGKVLYRVTFEVLPPDQIPELATACGFENMLS